MSSLIDEQQVWPDSSGAPIVNGFIHIGVQNQDPTLLANKITIYSDRDLSVSISNPQRTDANGRSVNKIWIPAKYSITVQDSDSAQKYSELDAGESPATGISNLTNIAGANAITADASPTISALVDKEIYIFTAIGTNTGAVTLAIDLVAPVSVVKFHDQALVDGDIEINQVVSVMYNGTDDTFELLSGTAAANLPSGATAGGVLINTNPSVVANHIRAGNTQLYDGATQTDIIVVNLQAADVWETYGPTGSGADNIWTAMDNIPANATILIARVFLAVSTNSISFAVGEVFATRGNSTEGPLDESNRVAYIASDHDVAITGQDAIEVMVYIPLEPDNLDFRVQWQETNSDSTTVRMFYVGFMTD